LRDHEDEIRRAGAGIAAVGLGDQRYASTFQQETGITFPLLVDDRRQAYRILGLKQGSLLHLLRRDNARARKRAAAWLCSWLSRDSDTSITWPISGKFFSWSS